MREGKSGLIHIDMLGLPSSPLKGPMALPIKVCQIEIRTEYDGQAVRRAPRVPEGASPLPPS